MSESRLLADIQFAFSRGNARLLRANAGMGWTGHILERTAERLVLCPYRPFRAMPQGVSDLIGWRGGQFVAIEGKFGRRQPTEEQAAFIALVLEHGGIAGVVRSVDEARALLYP